MIKILKEGYLKPETEEVYVATCLICGCEFEFILEDCISIEKTPNGRISIECPYCHKESSYVRSELKSYERPE